MKKQLTKTYYVSDFSNRDELASTAVYPTGKHATAQEAKGMEVEIQYPELLGGGQSGFKLPIDPEYHDGKLEFVIRLKRGNEEFEITKAKSLENPIEEKKEIKEIKKVAKKVK